jgi:hypothetical protein
MEETTSVLKLYKYVHAEDLDDLYLKAIYSQRFITLHQTLVLDT